MAYCSQMQAPRDADIIIPINSFLKNSPEPDKRRRDINQSVINIKNIINLNINKS